jgi:hypothetical protein
MEEYDYYEVIITCGGMTTASIVHATYKTREAAEEARRKKIGYFNENEVTVRGRNFGIRR